MPTRARHYRFGVIPGDGIGPEIVAAALDVLGATAAEEAFSYELVPLAGGAQTYCDTGSPLSPEHLEEVRHADATLKGPVGLPEVRLPDGTEAGLLGGLLRGGSISSRMCGRWSRCQGSLAHFVPSRARSTT